MYHPTEPFGAQVLFASAFSSITTLYPDGASVVLLKPNVTSSAVYAEILGLCLHCLNRFNVNVYFLIRLHNKCIGKFGPVLKSPEMKWLFQVWTSLSAAFILCTPGGTSRTSTPWL